MSADNGAGSSTSSTKRSAIHVGPEPDPEIVRAVEAGGGLVVADPAAASGAVILTADQAYVDRIVASDVEWIQMPWAGIDHWDLRGSPKSRRVYTAAGPAYARAVAEHAVAAALALHKGLHQASRVKTWSRDLETRQLRGASVLLVGTGRIGSAISDLLQPWKVALYGMNRTGRVFSPATETYRLGSPVPELSDISLAICSLPHTSDTHRVLDAPFFQALGKGSFFVNVGRGAVVDTGALIASLDTGHLAGAALDVTDPEPLPDEHPLWEMEQVLITPHLANPPGIVGLGLADLVADNVARWIGGEPLTGVVDPERGY